MIDILHYLSGQHQRTQPNRSTAWQNWDTLRINSDQADNQQTDLS
jgi:hypothetical protein